MLLQTINLTKTYMNIPILSRIIAAVDAYVAIEELKKYSGNQFN